MSNERKPRGPLHFTIDAAQETMQDAMQETARKSAPAPGKPAAKEHINPTRAPMALPAEEAETVQPAFEAEAQQAALVDADDSLPRRNHWPVRLLGWGVSLLLALAAALGIDALLRAAFGRADWLGWLAVGIVGLSLLAAVALALREVAGLWRIRRMARLRRQAETVLAAPDEERLQGLVHAVMKTYRKREDMRWALRRLQEHGTAALSPAERLRLLELEVLQPLDARAQRIILRAARDVAGLTAIVPAAVLDVLIVALRNLRMLRQLAALYGGRPGLLGGWKLGRMVLGHLAVTGAIALTDAFLPHLLGKGLAGRLSARFGEGVVNGVLTARIGLAALDHVRPLPFSATARPGLKQLAQALISGNDNP